MPTVVLPPATLSTDQVTLLSVAPVTVAVNCTLCEGEIEVLLGTTTTLTPPLELPLLMDIAATE